MESHHKVKSGRGRTVKHIKLSKPIRVNRKGERIKEISAPLQRKYLGEDSEVLILRDITPIRKEEERYDDVDESSSATAAAATGEEDPATKRRREIREALEASIAGKQAVAGQEEANEQINKLRPVSAEGPQYPAFISRKELKALRTALKDGYAVAQLRRYADVQESLDQLQQLKREERAELGVLWESAWQEGTSPIEQRLPEADRPDVPVAALPKMKVVDRIIRGLWGVGVIEESDALGEIEIKLEPWQFDLLTLAKQSENFTILDNIGYQRKVRIESYRPENILRFTAERETAEAAVTDIERLLRRFLIRKLDLQDFESLRQKRGLETLRDFFSQKDLEFTARLSNTVIDSSSESAIMIYAMDTSTFELARRTLINIINPPSGAETSIMADAEGEGFLQTSIADSSLHHRDREKNYARWTFPVKREEPTRETSQALDEEPASEILEDSTNTPTEAQPDHTPGDRTQEVGSANSRSQPAQKVIDFFTSRLSRSSDASREPRGATRKESLWSPFPLIEYYATFGNILHKPPPTNDPLSPISFQNIVEHEGGPKRIFLHTLPGFSPFLQHITSKASLSRHSNDLLLPDALLFRFMPSPWDLEDPSSLEDFPEMGLRIEVNSLSGKARFQGLGMTLRERNMDVLMPGKPVDVRFTQREVLWTDRILDRSEEIRDYLTRITTNVDGGGAIRAPPTLTIRIPAWAVKNSDKYKHLPFEFTKLGKEYIKEFIYTGVEHRQMSRYELPNGQHRVSYTSVEGGRVGGRRGELRLRLRGPAKTTEQLKAQVPGLVKEAFNMASTIEDALHHRLQPSDPNVKSYMYHRSYKRLSREGTLEDPLPPTYREPDDEGGKNVEKAASEGGETEQATAQAKEEANNARVVDDDAPLQPGAN
ncbi:hypothetical protein BFW01_g7641 [Lasiodiplodia theobromae]|nr:hypothetical protein BFW01_g7641 [Lasiodiplodia theobromae]